MIHGQTCPFIKTSNDLKDREFSTFLKISHVCAYGQVSRFK